MKFSQKLFITSLLMIGSTICVYAQNKTVQLAVIDDESAKKENKLEVSFDVDLVNSVEYVELKTAKSKKAQHIRTTLDNYFLLNPESDDVYIRVNVGQLENFADKKGIIDGELSVFGPSGKLMSKFPIKADVAKLQHKTIEKTKVN